MASLYGEEEAFIAAFDAFEESFVDDTTPLVQVVVADFFWEDNDVSLDDLRVQEKLVSFYIEPDTGITSVSVHDLRKITRTAAGLGLLTTLLVCLILTLGSLVI